MVGFPDWPERVRDHLPLTIAAGSRGEQVPDAATEVGPAEENVGVEREGQQPGHDLRQAELRHLAPPEAYRSGSTRPASGSG